MLEYKTKIRLLKVYTMDGAVKTVQVCLENKRPVTIVIFVLSVTLSLD